MENGIVKVFNEKKGYGFISTTSGVDYFVHYTNIISNDDYKKLQMGDKVSFDIEDGPRGQLAVNVRKVDD